MARHVYLLVQEEQSEPQSDVDHEQNQQASSIGKRSSGLEMEPRAAKRAQCIQHGSRDSGGREQGNANGENSKQRGSRAQKHKDQEQAPRPLVFKWRQPPQGVTQGNSQRPQQLGEEKQRGGSSQRPQQLEEEKQRGGGRHQQQLEEEKQRGGGRHQQQQQEEEKPRGGSHLQQQQTRQQVWDNTQHNQQGEEQQHLRWGKPWQQSSVWHGQGSGEITLAYCSFSTAPLLMYQQYSLPTEKPRVKQLSPDWGLVSHSLPEPVLMYRPDVGSLPLARDGHTAAVAGVGASESMLSRLPSDGSLMQSCSTAGGLMRFSSTDSESYSSSSFGGSTGASKVCGYGSPGEQQGIASQRDSPFVASIGSLAPDEGFKGDSIAARAEARPVLFGEQQALHNWIELEQQEAVQQQQVPQVPSVGGLDELTHDDLMQQLLLEHVHDHHLWHQQQQQQQMQLDSLQAGGGAAAGGSSAQQLCGNGSAAMDRPGQQQQEQLQLICLQAVGGPAAGGSSAQQVSGNVSAASDQPGQQQEQLHLDSLQAGGGPAAGSFDSAQQHGSESAATGLQGQQQQLSNGAELVGSASSEMKLERQTDDRNHEQLLLPVPGGCLSETSLKDEALNEWLTGVLAHQAALCSEDESGFLY